MKVPSNVTFASYQEASEAKEKIVEEIFNDRNVVSVGVVQGEKKEDFIIQVGVLKLYQSKIPKDHVLDSKRVVPIQVVPGRMIAALGTFSHLLKWIKP